MLTFVAGDASAAVDPADGGRLTSLRVHGHEVLVGPGDDAMRWGSYPMVPFAGRIRNGTFVIDGRRYDVPTNLGRHAIHGYGYTSAWAVVDEHTIELRFAAPWPFRGRVRQRFALETGALRLTMIATAEERQPLMIGWHPWFRRDIGVGAPLSFTFGPAEMYELADDEIPTGRLVEVPPGPWDNCFTHLAHEPVLRWGEALTLTLSSSADHWVIYDRPEQAVCIEPQTDAPDAVNRGRTVVDAGERVEIELVISW